ncbi:4,5-DOPA dioxygenase extradiol [Caulobacter segnis]|uniref:4,5-DOPA-extradiol-dioxygenase n=1 Tax=Caulobacter segnis TaxID=88688 RepID=UPI00240F7092|nr:4,5-DOPA dioxygenase extradiol [Caulobacter segnis]MDG2523570.1 4,5-DOPA dioxygenase extradiol [Caulobacter segnis]
MSRMPVLFLGHGSPMNAIEDNAWSRGWAKIGKELPRPKAILMISAHWETRGIGVTSGTAPHTIHDFFGFPQALFDVRYPAPGDPALAARVAELLSPEPVVFDAQRGFDHGNWGVLIAAYPKADIPVVQLSLDRCRTPQEHYELARRLAPLRDEGVLIVGSGDIVHNLRAADFRKPEAPPWADRFNETAKRLIEAGDHGPLIDYASLGEDALASINSAEHYLPLLYVLGAQQPGDPVSFFNDDVFAAISMTSVKVG